jgi:23S rRNA (cytidine1920-2'-O)/16S rRNA (cytidine1409-2'-O)-methyltransferase
MPRPRLDQALVERGFFPSREKAQRAVLAGQVRVSGRLARKSSEPVKPDDDLVLAATERYVSRGGYKLEHGLHHFQVDAAGLAAIDLGASNWPGNSGATRASWSWKKPTPVP